VPMIPNTELVARYDTTKSLSLTTPTLVRVDRTTLGLVYYITNTFQFEGCYEFVTSSPNAPNSSNRFILQLSYGF